MRKRQAAPRRRNAAEIARDNRETLINEMRELQRRERLEADYAGLGFVRFHLLAGRLADAADFPQSDARPLFTGAETARKCALYREFQTILEELLLQEDSPYISSFDRAAAIDKGVEEGTVLRFKRHKGRSMNREINARYCTRYDNGDDDDRAS